MAKKARQIYMDYASTTPLDPVAVKAMRRYENKDFGNPSSIHSFGVSAKQAVEDSRKKIANVLNCRPSEVIFTSGGTEGDNMAILGLAGSVDKKNYKHIITTTIEHHAVSSPCCILESEGFEVTCLPVSKEGIVNPEDVKKALRPDTFLVSVMYANNEIGTIQPIAEIAKVIRRFRKSSGLSTYPLLHTDACQAPGSLSLNVAKLGVDMMTLSGSKVYGPKGVGCLYIRNGVKISPLVYGGGQEKGLRSGTENVAGTVGFAEALNISNSIKDKEVSRLTKLRNYFANQILRTISGAEINGSLKEGERLPNNLNIYIPDIDNEQLVIELDTIGVAVSAGSACHSNEADNGSHVISALGYNMKRSKGSIRFSFGRSTTKKDIDYVLKSLPEIIDRIRLIK